MTQVSGAGSQLISVTTASSSRRCLLGLPALSCAYPAAAGSGDRFSAAGCGRFVDFCKHCSQLVWPGGIPWLHLVHAGQTHLRTDSGTTRGGRTALLGALTTPALAACSSSAGCDGPGTELPSVGARCGDCCGGWAGRPAAVPGGCWPAANAAPCICWLSQAVISSCFSTAKRIQFSSSTPKALVNLSSSCQSWVSEGSLGVSVHME